jgi:hypothetical protein
MNNLFKKVQILQFIIVISFYLLSNLSENKDDKILEKDSECYIYLVNIVKYNNIIKPYLNNLTDNNIDNNIFLENNDYFYFFHNQYNVFAYFFKEKNSDTHQIYFNGINNIFDIKTIINILINNFTFENIEDILHKNGKLYNIIENKIEFMNENNNISILNVFDILSNIIYNIDNSKVNLKINGYSLGGPISQVFVYLILEKYKDKINIEVCNIESWFAGDKKSFDIFKNMLKFSNIYNKKSILYFFNIIFQKYNKADFYIDNSCINDNNIDKYISRVFPKGIIKYIKNYHLLSNILKEDL